MTAQVVRPPICVSPWKPCPWDTLHLALSSRNESPLRFSTCPRRWVWAVRGQAKDVPERQRRDKPTRGFDLAIKCAHSDHGGRPARFVAPFGLIHRRVARPRAGLGAGISEAGLERGRHGAREDRAS